MSYGHVELVYQRSTHQGAAHQVLAYLALRANENHICWPGYDRMAADLRISKRTVIRAMQDLADVGDVLLVREGNGRGNSSIWMLSENYRPDALMGDTTSPFETVNGDNSSPITEKGDIDDKKGDMVSERVTLTTTKGDTMSPQHKENIQKEHKENEREIPRTRARAGKAPAGAGEYETLWYEYTGTWLGAGLEGYLREQLGPAPRWELVRTASGRYRARGYRANDAEGICDWYHNLAADPNWEPPARYRPRKNGANPGNQPKTFGQIREENNKAAAEEFKRLIRQGATHGTS